MTKHASCKRALIRRAFTLVEMLIAMAVTLLLMAALAKSFGLIGESVRDGRAKVELTAVARDITLRINDELSRCTVPLTPPTTETNGAGYFLYFEGPLTDTTAAIMGRSPSVANAQTFQDSKYGDLDDYLAFTAMAQEGNWFRGKVPRFVLDQKTADLQGVAYAPANFPGTPIDPIMITSKYAEIIYFASPEYLVEPDQAAIGQQIYNYDNTGNPRPIDFEGNGLPDRVRLHRRVLLVRPDLNLSAGFITPFAFNGVEYLAPDLWDVDTTAGTIPSIKTPGTHGLNVAQTGNAWLIGMAPVHQQCDLSLRRVVDRSGRPTNQVAANSLGDLTKPENRFAHVRMPGDRFGGTTLFTSMPLIALGGRLPILDPTTLDPPIPVAPPLVGPVITPIRMNGFLRPEFVLGQDFTHTDVVGDGWGLDRFGEDILATNVLGFDVQAFDPLVGSYITPGPDGVFGSASGLGAGASASDDVLVTPNDIAIREVLGNPPIPATGQRGGGFVDLCYPFLAGGTIRGIGPRNLDRHGSPATSVTELNFRIFLETPMSGVNRRSYRLPNNAATGGLEALYTRELYKSGRVVTAPNGNVELFQPAYDTFSDHYERDGFLQTFPAFNGGAAFGTVWYFNDANGFTPTGYSRAPDLGSNGIDDGGLAGVDDLLEKETRPPFDAPLRAIRVSIRLEDPNTRQIQQMSAVREFIQ